MARPVIVDPGEPGRLSGSTDIHSIGVLNRLLGVEDACRAERSFASPNGGGQAMVASATTGRQEFFADF